MCCHLVNDQHVKDLSRSTRRRHIGELCIHTIFSFLSAQVLYVPRHWWHYVESVDPITVSVNSWIELVSSQFIYRLK